MINENKSVVGKSNIEIFDVTKFVLSIFVVAIHTVLFPSVLYPWLRIAVPIFFMISSYLFFSKIKCEQDKQKTKALYHFIKRNLTLYSVWFVILLPFTVIARKSWFSEGILKGVIYFIRGLLFGSTFRASWYIMALVIATAVVFYGSKLLKNRCILLIGIFLYFLCCLTSNYRNAIDGTALTFICEISDNVFGGISTSFISAIVWIVIGKIFAETDKRIPLKLTAILLIVIGIILYFEYYCIQLFFEPTANDNYISLILFCPCLFNLILQLKHIKIPNATIARKCSTVIYMIHCEIAMCVGHLLKLFNLSDAIFTFAFTLIISVMTGFIVVKLQTKFKWLKYLM